MTTMMVMAELTNYIGLTMGRELGMLYKYFISITQLNPHHISME